MDTLEEVVADVYAAKCFAWDCEAVSKTNNPNDAKIPELARLTHVSISGPTKSGCWDLSTELMEGLTALLKNPALYHMVYHGPYDIQLLHWDGHLDFKEIKAKLLDPMGLVFLTDEEDQKGLKYSVKKFCKINMVTFDDVVKSSPAAKALIALESHHSLLRKTAEMWHKKSPKRPYPDFSCAPISKTAIRKILRTDNPSMKTKTAKSLVEELFQECYYDDFIKYIEKVEARDSEQIKKYREKVNEHMKKYARDDSARLFDLLKKVMAVINKERTDHVIPVEMAIHMETIAMRIEGININRDKMEVLREKLARLKEQFRQEAFDIAKQEFNLGSTLQLRQILFVELGAGIPAGSYEKRGGAFVKVPSYTKAGQSLIKEKVSEGHRKYGLTRCDDRESIPPDLAKFLACDVKVLERVPHPLAQVVLNYRVVDKLLGTYVEATLKSLDSWGDGKLHGSFKNFSTVTNRFSSSGPNLQTLPSKGKSSQYHVEIQKLGMELRGAFIPPPPDVLAPEGYTFVQVDHSQIELRVSAHFTKDKTLNAVYTQGVTFNGTKFYTGDVHFMTQSLIGCTRKEAKIANFSSSYGAGPLTFARQGNLFIGDTMEYDLKLAERLLLGFFEAYPNVGKFMEACSDTFKSGQRLFPTIGGRWRHFYDQDRGKGFRPAKGKIFNSIIQGSAADILKYCMFIIVKYVYESYPGTAIILQIHDEVILKVPKRFADEVAVLVKYIMEYPWYKMSVPVLSGAKIVDNWGDAGNDDIPEVGTFYAVVDGQERTFDKDNWHEFITADNEGRVSNKSACAQLLPDQIEWCRARIPQDMPLPKRSKKTRIMSRVEMMKEGLV